jgi:undecaprenyl pyrophosphate phosphatase UppP
MRPLGQLAKDRVVVIAVPAVVGVGLLLAAFIAAWFVAVLSLVGIFLLVAAWMLWKDSAADTLPRPTDPRRRTPR